MQARNNIYSSPSVNVSQYVIIGSPSHESYHQTVYQPQMFSSYSNSNRNHNNYAHSRSDLFLFHSQSPTIHNGYKRRQSALNQFENVPPLKRRKLNNINNHNNNNNLNKTQNAETQNLKVKQKLRSLMIYVKKTKFCD